MHAPSDNVIPSPPLIMRFLEQPCAYRHRSCATHRGPNSPLSDRIRTLPAPIGARYWSRSMLITAATRSRSVSQASSAAWFRQATAAIMQSIRPRGVTPARRHRR